MEICEKCKKKFWSEKAYEFHKSVNDCMNDIERQKSLEISSHIACFDEYCYGEGKCL